MCKKEPRGSTARHQVDGEKLPFPMQLNSGSPGWTLRGQVKPSQGVFAKAAPPGLAKRSPHSKSFIDFKF